MKVFILICSAHSMRERRDGIRATWLKRLLPNMNHRFYVGQGPGAPADEPDVVQLDTGDSWSGLTHKIQAAFQHSLQFDYDWLFKVDDDSYVVPERFHLAFTTCVLPDAYPVRPGGSRERRGTEPDYIGGFGVKQECYGLGCGYILARKWVERLAVCPKEPELLDSEDGWVGQHCRDWTRFYYTEVIHHKCDHDWPKPDNQVMLCHEVRGVEMMFKYHARYLCATPSVPLQV